MWAWLPDAVAGEDSPHFQPVWPVSFKMSRYQLRYTTTVMHETVHLGITKSSAQRLHRINLPAEHNICSEPTALTIEADAGNRQGDVT
jgi:hypothetical protein